MYSNQWPTSQVLGKCTAHNTLVNKETGPSGMAKLAPLRRLVRFRPVFLTCLQHARHVALVLSVTCRGRPRTAHARACCAWLANASHMQRARGVCARACCPWPGLGPHVHARAACDLQVQVTCSTPTCVGRVVGFTKACLMGAQIEA